MMAIVMAYSTTIIIVSRPFHHSSQNSRSYVTKAISWFVPEDFDDCFCVTGLSISAVKCQLHQSELLPLSHVLFLLLELIAAVTT